MVRSGGRINAQNRNAYGAAIQRNRVDVYGTVVLDRLGSVLQVRGTLGAVEAGQEHFGKARLGRIAAGSASRPTLRIVNCKRYGLQIALVIEPGLLDKAFVLGIV